MKELTIEEKAKAYDEALERAKEWYDNPNSSSIGKGYIYAIFPELKESKGEMIRQLLMRFVKYDMPDNYSDDFSKEDCLAWLEKQGEQKLQIEKLPSEMKTIGESLNFTSQEECDEYNQMVSDLIMSNSDKIEPKFKVGDWIVQENIGVYKVIEVCESWYEVIDNQNNHYSIGFDKEYMCHLWSIKDAKDGDVLHSTGFDSECIFIFNGLDNWKFDEPNGDRAVATAHCCITVSGDKMEFGMQGPDCIEVNTIKPATKIQHDLLFQKMKEAGYEWNEEKKELKKFYIIDEGKDEMDYCFTKMMNGEKVSSAWGKEDEEIMSGLLSFLLINTSDQWAKYGKWILSLKERMRR